MKPTNKKSFYFKLRKFFLKWNTIRTLNKKRKLLWKFNKFRCYNVHYALNIAEVWYEDILIGTYKARLNEHLKPVYKVKQEFAETRVDLIKLIIEKYIEYLNMEIQQKREQLYILKDVVTVDLKKYNNSEFLFTSKFGRVTIVLNADLKYENIETHEFYDLFGLASQAVVNYFEYVKEEEIEQCRMQINDLKEQLELFKLLQTKEKNGY